MDLEVVVALSTTVEAPLLQWSFSLSPKVIAATPNPKTYDYSLLERKTHPLHTLGISIPITQNSVSPFQTLNHDNPQNPEIEGLRVMTVLHHPSSLLDQPPTKR